MIAVVLRGALSSDCDAVHLFATMAEAEADARRRALAEIDAMIAGIEWDPETDDAAKIEIDAIRADVATVTGEPLLAAMAEWASYDPEATHITIMVCS